jgi:hypothetical protein
MKNSTDVIFRIDTTPEHKGVVFALFPHDCETHEGLVGSYQRVGQHSTADYGWCIRKSRPATPQEYADLKSELETIGYDVRVVVRRNYAKYLASLKRLRV